MSDVLADSPIVAVIPASDLERAKRFYRDTLGLKVSMEMADGVGFDSGGTRFFVYATPSGGQAAHTLASWEVPDLDSEMADLKARGITFEEYDEPGLKTVHGVVEMDGIRGCWFKDSEGNILSLTQTLAE